MPRLNFKCPDCGCKNTKVYRVTHNTRGTKRCVMCNSCGNRWREWAQAPKPVNYARKVNSEAVKTILTTSRDVSDKKLAEQIGVSRQTINQIRAGRAHAHIHPELPRRGRVLTRTCESCAHWIEGCAYGFPEPDEGFLEFAAECVLYSNAKT